MTVVPSPKLLFWFALLGLPMGAVASAVPGGLVPAGLALLALTAVAAFDAWRSTTLLEGISLQLPGLVRLQKNSEGTLAARIRNATAKARTIRVGLPFPQEIPAPMEDATVALPAGAEFSSFSWTCRPAERGQYFLRQYFLETASRLGLWAVRAKRAADCELRVFPSFLDERKHVAALFLNRGHTGIHSQRQAGKGRDFEKLREYIAGDSYDEIHWKASAKRGRPVTKVFQVERTQEVYVVLDASRLMARDPGQFEKYITAALLLAVAAEQQGDAFGLIAFSDRVLNFARARTGKAQFGVCRDMLYQLRAQSVTPDFDELAAFIRTRLRKRSLLIFLTALDDPGLSESFAHAIDLICRQNLIMVNMLQPALAQPLFANGDVVNVDDVYTKLGGHLLWQDLRELGETLQRRGVRFSLLESEKLAARLVSQYVQVKAMQLL